MSSWISPYQTQNNLDYFQLEIFKINPHRDKNLVVPTFCGISKQNLSQLIHQRFVHAYITRLELMSIKGLMEGLPENISELEDPCLIYILTKETKILRGPTTNVSKISPGFMLQMDFASFHVEIIRGFTSTFVAIFSDTSYSFGFTYRSKCLPLDILKFLVTTLRNQDNKVAFIRVDEYGSLAISFGSMKKWHNMNIIVQTTGGDASSINGKNYITNKTLDKIMRALQLGSIHKKELWCFAYQYVIWISRRNENRLCCDVPYFLWHGTRPSCI